MSSKNSSLSKKKTSSSTSPDVSGKRIKIPKEFIVRAATEHSYKNDMKIYVSSDILEGLDLKAGMFVKLDPVSSGELGFIALIYPDNSLVYNNVIKISKGLRKFGKLLLGDRVHISKYGSQPPYATSLLISTSSGPDIDVVRKRKIEKCLDDIGLVFCGFEFDLSSTNEENLTNNLKIRCKPTNDSLLEALENLKLSTRDHSLSSHDSDLISQVFIFAKGKTLVHYVEAEEDNPNKPAFQEVGGLLKEIELLKDTINLPLENPELFAEFGITPPRGVLLHGPPGTGKTMLLRCIANDVEAHILSISCSEIVSKYLGETEGSIRDIFQEAKRFQPSIIFMDEVDSLVPNRSSDDSGEAESRVVATLLTMMDGIGTSGRVVVVGATNRPNKIDPALRRPGRFDQEIEIGIPNVEARFDILSKQFSKMTKSKHDLNAEDIRQIAEKTHGYVGADLSALCRESVMKAISRGLNQGIAQKEIKLSKEDLINTMAEIRPSAMREVFLETPKVYWSDIGGQKDLKRKLLEVVQLPLESAATFKKLGVLAPKGVLLYGPPGCSKTLAAKALATESGINFIAVKGPEIFNKYVGESEKTIREIFRKARAASPSIIFFDEIDAIAESRDDAHTSASLNVLTTLLNEIDGIEVLKEVIIVGATNRPTEIDPALLRPGRLDRHIYVAPPDLEARKQIITNCSKLFHLDEHVNIEELAKFTEGCSGAEVTLLCQEAGLAAIMEKREADHVSKRHFDHAIKNISRGITKEMISYYEAFSTRGGLSL